MSRTCKPTPITCQLSSWTRWSSCAPTNGKCGYGKQSRVRSITRKPVCSALCGSVKDERKCFHICCPTNCVYTTWSGWSSCSSNCGQGLTTRMRSISKQESCGGISCNLKTLKESKKCQNYVNVNCKLSAWSAWGVCSNRCGTGTQEKTRSIITKPSCYGKKCSGLVEKQSCNDYSSKRNCQVSQWGSWSTCDNKCGQGSKLRYRQILVSQVCGGTKCPDLKSMAQCGKKNGGCDQLCNNGVCSCRPGFDLIGTRKCKRKNCGVLLMDYCPPGMKSPICKWPDVNCPGDQTGYPVKCDLTCDVEYNIIGTNSVSCLATGSWSPSHTYCKLINQPPTDILLSNHDLQENSLVGTVIGRFSSADIDTSDSHQYTLVKDSCAGCFAIIGDELRANKVFDFESMSQSYQIWVQSTDNATVPLSFQKVFTINIDDLNESPTDITLSNDMIDENSGVDTIVGELQTVDPDVNQTFIYEIQLSLVTYFKIKDNKLYVALSNDACLRKGNPSLCSLNFEENTSVKVTIMAVDNGNPSQSFAKTFTIKLRNINDPPYNITLSSNSVKENAPANTLIGHLNAMDEDKNQKLSFKILNDPKKDFYLSNDGKLYKAKSSDYEKFQQHRLEIEVSDDGTPIQKSHQWFTINILDVNEPPVNVTIIPSNQTFAASDGAIAVPENTTIGTHIGFVNIYDTDDISKITIKLVNNKFNLEKNDVTCTKDTKTKQSLCQAKLYVAQKLDYEQGETIQINFHIIERGLASFRAVTIKLIDSNDLPQSILINNGNEVSIFENLQGVSIGFLKTVDEDKNQHHKYEYFFFDDTTFQINGNLLSLQNNVAFNYESIKQYKLLLRSTDNGLPPMSVNDTITIKILNENDPPSKVSLANLSLFEDVPIGSIISDIHIIDEDIALPNYKTHPCELVNSSYFSIVKNQLKLIKSLDYETENKISVTVEVTDKTMKSTWYFTIKVLDVNENPTSIALSNTNILENSITPTFVSNLSANDPDTRGNGFTYEILTNKKLFMVQNNQLYALQSFNFESMANIDVEIKVTDSENLSLTELKYLAVVDANDPISDIELSSNVLKENSDINTQVGYITAIDEDAQQSYTCVLTEDSEGRFELIGFNLTVAVSNSKCLKYGGHYCRLNFEENHLYYVEVNCEDNGLLAHNLTKAFKIFLSDVNEKPFNLTLSGFQLPENSPISYGIGILSAQDEDLSDVLTFSLLSGTNDFYIDQNNTLRKKTNFSDYEKNRFHKIIVKVQDSGSPQLMTTQDFTIEIINENEAPVDVKITSDNTHLNYSENTPIINENNEMYTILGTVYAYDEDVSAELNITLDDNAENSFKISKNITCVKLLNANFKSQCFSLLTTNKKFDFEEKSSYKIIIRATDKQGLHHVQQFTVSINDINEAPTQILLGGKSTASVEENRRGTFIADISTIDDDFGQYYTYEILTNKKLFTIKRSKLYLQYSSSFDYEVTKYAEVEIKSTDSGGLSFQEKFNISVLDVNERPFKIKLEKTSVLENSPSKTIISKITVYDPDNFGDTVTQTHTCYVTGRYSSIFTVNNTQGNRLLLKGSVDYEKARSFKITIKCTDSGTPQLSDVEQLTIRVLNINEPPTDIKLSSNKIAENLQNKIIGSFKTSDPDRYQSFKYTLLNTTVPFRISRHLLISTQMLDYETKNVYRLAVKVTDNGRPPLSLFKTFNIYVTGVNEAPTNITLNHNTVLENSGTGTVIGNFATADEDMDGNGNKNLFDYKLTHNPSGIFRLVGDQLQVAIDNSSCRIYGGTHCKLNFEKNRNITIRVKSTDNGNPQMSIEKDFQIKIIDQNDPPRQFKLSSNILPENATQGYVIGLFTVTDEDVWQDHTMFLVSDDNGRFAINRNSELVKMKDTNYETQKVHRIYVEATDNGIPNMKVSKEFDIFIQDINESPTNLSIVSDVNGLQFPSDKPLVSENLPIGSVVGKIRAIDQDTVKDLQFMLLDNSENGFMLDKTVTCLNISIFKANHTQCETLLFTNKSLNYESDSQHKITVKVVDHAGLSHVMSFDISVKDANDQPSNVTVQGETLCFVKENIRYRLIGTLESEDEDGDQDFSYKLVDDANGRFVIHKDRFGTYQLYTSGVLLNYEENSQYIIRIMTTDNGLPPKRFTNNITVMVIDVNEYPSNIMLDNPYVREDATIGTFVSNITIIDPDVGQTHICKIAPNDFFTLSKTPLNGLILSGIVDYETHAEVIINILCKDSGYPSRHLQKDISIQIVDVNEPPTGISMTGSTLPENVFNYNIGRFIAVDEDKMDNHTFILVNSNSTFQIVNGDMLQNIVPLNHEKKQVYDIKVKVFDKKGESYVENFRIFVEDQNDAPSTISCSGTFELAENALPGTSFGVCTAVDEESYQTHKLTVTGLYGIGYSSDDLIALPSPLIFSIGITTGKLELLNTKLDYETFFEYVITLRATDNGSPVMFVERNFSISVTNINQPPTQILISNDKVPENTAEGVIFSNITVVDPDNVRKKMQTHSCWISNTDGTVSPFQIDFKDQISVKNSDLLDYEIRKYFKVQILCTEDEDYGYSINRTFDILISDVNEAPVIISLLPSNVINEHNKIDLPVAMVKYADPDNRNVHRNNISSAVIDAHGWPFKLKFPYLYATQVLDYEQQSKYIITITLTDDGIPKMSNSQNITIQIGNLNDAPEDIVLDKNTIAEDTKPGTTIALLSTVDKDKEQAHNYELLDNAGLFQISGEQLILIGQLNFELQPIIKILVNTTDNGDPPLWFQKELTLKIIDANDAPTEIKVTINPLPENTVMRYMIINMKVLDEDISQPHTCQCISGNKDLVEFVSQSNGNVSMYIKSGNAFDFEFVKMLKFEIRCSDNGLPPLSVTRHIDVPIEDVNEKPTEILLSGSKQVMLNENPIAGQVVGVLSCQDADVGQSHTYELIEDATVLFKVQGNNLLVNNITNFDYESSKYNALDIKVKVTDNGTPKLSLTDALIISASDVNEAPTNIHTKPQLSVVAENIEIGTYLGEIISTDPESLFQVITYDLLNYKDTFQIVTTQAQNQRCYLNLIRELDYDEQPSYEISIKATDNGKPRMSSYGTIVFNITKTDPCSLSQMNCSFHASCKRYNKTVARCVCDDGFKIKDGLCQPIDECQHQCEYCIGNNIDNCNSGNFPACSPCQNNGNCTDVHRNYTCACVQGYTGHDCSIDIDDCANKPCMYDSTCLDHLNGFTCVCRKGYTGLVCETEINECNETPCYKGDCVDLVNGFQCNCPPGFSGLRCQRDENICTAGSCAQSEICHPTVLETSEKKFVCVPGDFVSMLSFPRNFAKLSDKEATSWKVQFQSFLTNVEIPLAWLRIESNDPFERALITDARIIDYEGSLLYSVVKRAVANTNESTSVDELTKVKFYALYKSTVIPPNALLYAVNETCEELYNDCSTVLNRFECSVCKVVAKYLSDSDAVKKPSTSASTEDKDDGDSTLMYVVIASAVMGFILIILISIFVVRKRRSRSLTIQKNRSTVQNGTSMNTFSKRSRTITHEEEHYIGQMNPIYGLNEDEIQSSGLYDNAVPADLFAKKTKEKPKMFANPAFNMNDSGYTEFDNPETRSGIQNPLYDDLTDNTS